jgi:hypothetical protein
MAIDRISLKMLEALDGIHSIAHFPPFTVSIIDALTDILLQKNQDHTVE